ncbi:MAG: AMP-binding protein, partial [Gammaproteobacteria bacterium]
LEFWLPLMVGATLFIQDCPTGQNGLEILGAIEAHGITALQARPDVWSHIMTTGWSGNPELTGLIGGSSITPELIDFLSPRLKELWFCYGTTESTVWNTTQRLHPHTPAGMIGQPLAHSRVYILNAAGQAMAEGWTGDVYIGGACLTHGYLKNRLETKARFVELALENGATVRLLRTGDRARWQANGVLEYQGRTDRLVKIAGYRTDLSEIEQCIETMHKVHRAVVRAVSSTTSARTTQLIAFVEPTPENTLTPYDITHYLKRLLPIHSIPQQICCPVHIPFNQNAQPKWSQLPSPEELFSGRPPQPWQPQNRIESYIAQLWQRLLKVENISRWDNFFELGGHSLLALAFLHALHAKGIQTLTLKDLSTQTLADLSTQLQNHRATHSRGTPPSPPVHNVQRPSIFKRVRKTPQA